MKKELLEKIENSIRQNICFLCGGKLFIEGPQKSPDDDEETLDFFSCDDCNSTITIFSKQDGSVDYDFCCISHRDEEELCES
jgi:hypothetical protein